MISAIYKASLAFTASTAKLEGECRITAYSYVGLAESYLA